VPAFRHADLAAASRYCKQHSIPLIFDPLISAWDKAVYERKKFRHPSWRSRRLLAQERALFARADVVLADTQQHADFFVSTLRTPAAAIAVVPVGAEEDIFVPQSWPQLNEEPEVLFYGSFIDLQAPQVIAAAAVAVPRVRWSFVGDGPWRRRCEEICKDQPHVVFEPWIDYTSLPARIGRATILLGVFGDSAKAGRVIPNKVYQALACARPVITRASDAYPSAALRPDSGLIFLPPADPQALADEVARRVENLSELVTLGRNALKTFERFFSERRIEADLMAALNRAGLGRNACLG
jgi:glycosyltransferase involved in cell wall biosynthesis